MAYYKQEIIDQVKKLDLFSYLKNYDPDELVYISRDNYCTKTHDSLKISNGKWFWFSKGFGGYNALDYLIKVRGYKFSEAMKIILNHSRINPPIQYENKEKIKDYNLVLPEKNTDNKRVIDYLTSRGIDKDIVLECIDNELIYEEKNNHNVVFIGRDPVNKPRYASVRGTNKTRFMKEAYGSHKAFSFKLDSLNNSDEIHLFESAIDLLSYATILKLEDKEWYNYNFLSLAGVYQPSKNIEDSKLPLALSFYLNQHQNIKKIVLHLDNDTTGRLATVALKMAMPKQYIVIDDPPKYGKDINDFLCFKRNIKHQKFMERRNIR